MVGPTPSPRHVNIFAACRGHFEIKMSCFSAGFQDDCPECSGPWPVCHVGVSNEGRSCSTALSYGMSKTRTQLGPGTRRNTGAH